LKERSCDCGRKVKKKYLKGNNWVCYYCYQKQFTKIPGQDKKCTSLDDAVKKIRKVRSYITKDGSIRCMIFVPSCFYGKKIMVKVVE